MRGIRVFALLVAVVVIGACFGGGGNDGANSPTLYCTYPPKGLAGDQVTLDGVFPDDPTFPIQVGFSSSEQTFGTQAQIVSKTTERIVVRVPAGSGASYIHVRNQFGMTQSRRFTYGAQTDVAEIEPNDAIDGSDATVAGLNIKAHGILSNPLDKDHFHFDGLCADWNMVLTITPRVVSVVYINGQPYNVAADGTVKFKPPLDTLDGDGKAVIGITGATGAYQIRMSVL